MTLEDSATSQVVSVGLPPQNSRRGACERAMQAQVMCLIFASIGGARGGHIAGK